MEDALLADTPCECNPRLTRCGCQPGSHQETETTQGCKQENFNTQNE